MNKNTFILNPKTNNFIFGKVPEIKLPRGYFPAGDIMLLHGRHMGINKGFGVANIWASHSHELQKIGYNDIDDVARYISDIIITGVGLFSEFEDMRGSHRVTVIQGMMGTAILEQRINQEGSDFYSVITAFPKGKPRGTRIGSVA